METQNTQAASRRFSGIQVFGIVLLTLLIAVVATVWIVRTYIFPAQFDPVQLSSREERALNEKLAQLDGLQPRQDNSLPRRGDGLRPGDVLEPEAYSEQGASRQIGFSEKELNALIARNTDLADKLAIDLSANLASAKLLIPLEPDFPILGGKTLRVSAGLELAYNDSRPVVVLKGVSIMGVPIPNAWLGNLKNVDLVSEFGGDRGFWQTFAAGVDFIEVRDSELRLALKE